MTPWQTKWLRLSMRHPKVQDLADRVQSFGFGWYRHNTTSRLLALTGPCGTGKTHCAKALHVWARYVAFSALERGFWRTIPSIQYCRWPEICSGFEAGQMGVMEDLTSSSLLILDDLGAESDRYRSGANNDRLCQALTRREDSRLYTLLTTNVTPDEWGNQFGQRAADRMLAGCVCDLSEMGSYRAEKYQQSNDAQ